MERLERMLGLACLIGFVIVILAYAVLTVANVVILLSGTGG